MKLNPRERMKMKQLANLLILFTVSCSLYAQQASFQAPLDQPAQNGLHAILLTPEIRMRSQKDLEDLRLRDSAGKDVPYVIIQSERQYDSVDFVTWPLLERQIAGKANTTLIFSPTEKGINSVWLELSNHGLSKQCSVSGSDDRKQWFGILTSCALPPAYDVSRAVVYCPIYLPEVSYRYYKIVINDSVSEPLNIHRLGYFRRSGTSAKMVPVNSSFSIEQDQAGKRTLLHVNLQGLQHVNSLELTVSSPNLYERTATITVSRTKTVRRRTETQKETWFTFRLSSARSGYVDIPPLYEKEFTIEIENKDSPPLTIAGFTCAQLPLHLVADLHRGARYTLFTGNPQLRKPEYDLASFVNTSPLRLPALAAGALTAVKSAATEKKPETSYLQSKTFIWTCVGLGGLLVALFAFGLIKDMGKGTP
jgi:hypothetical protein